MSEGSELFRAIEANDVAGVRRLLRAGLNANARDDHGLTALMVAPFYSGVEVSKALLEHGANVNARSSQGVTPLIQAVSAGNLPVVRLLVDRKADVNARTRTGMTALSMIGNRLLTEKKAKQSSTLQKDATETARFLIARGARVNVETSQKWTPLHFAALKGLSGVTCLLLEKGASVNARTDLGHSALLLAADQGWNGEYAETVKLLLAHGADRNLRNAEGETALNVARKRRNRQIIALLAKE